MKKNSASSKEPPAELDMLAPARREPDIHDSIDPDPSRLLSMLSEQGLTIRQRKVARLFVSGLDPAQIASELGKQSADWNLEFVLNLMGQGSGPYADTEVVKAKWNRAVEEIKQDKLLDPEADLKEFRSYCLTVVKNFVQAHTSDCIQCGRAVPSKEAAEMAYKWGRATGLGLDDGPRRVVEHRWEPEHLEAMRQVTAAIREGKNYLRDRMILEEMLEIDQPSH